MKSLALDGQSPPTSCSSDNGSSELTGRGVIGMISRGRVDLSAVAAVSPHGWEEGSIEAWMEPILVHRCTGCYSRILACC
jgi:hypothetical protein